MHTYSLAISISTNRKLRKKLVFGLPIIAENPSPVDVASVSTVFCYCCYLLPSIYVAYPQVSLVLEFLGASRARDSRLVIAQNGKKSSRKQRELVFGEGNTITVDTIIKFYDGLDHSMKAE